MARTGERASAYRPPGAGCRIIAVSDSSSRHADPGTPTSHRPLTIIEPAMRLATAAVLCFAMIATAAVPDLSALNRMIARFAPAHLKVDTSQLASGDQQALARLVDA